jgi:hypothetical protein
VKLFTKQKERGGKSMEDVKSYEQLCAERLEIRDRYPKVAFPDPVLEPIWYGRRPDTLVDGKKAIVNQATKGVFAVCSDQYKVLHYEDVIGMVEGVVKEIKGYGKIDICPTMLADGGRMKLGLKFPECQHLVRKKDAVIPKIEVFTSYDLRYKLMGRFGAFQLRCTNGCGVWKQFKQFARKHLLNLQIEDLKDTITEGLEVFGFQIESWRKWAEAKINQITYDAIWEELPFSAKEREKIEALPQIGENMLIPDALKQKTLTVWDFSSILTQYTTHELKSELRRIDLEPEIARSMEILYDRSIN